MGRSSWFDSIFEQTAESVSGNGDATYSPKTKPPPAQRERTVPDGEVVGAPKHLFSWKDGGWQMKLTKDAFKSMSRNIEPMQVVAFIGPRGSGKTTLINSMLKATAEKMLPAKTEGAYCWEYLLMNGRYLRFLDVEGWDYIGGMDVGKTRSLHALIYHLSSHIVYVPNRQDDGWKSSNGLYQNVVKATQDFSTVATSESNLRNFPTLHVLAFSFDSDLKSDNANDVKMKEGIWRVFPSCKTTKPMPEKDRRTLQRYTDLAELLRRDIVNDAPIKRLFGCHLYEEVFVHVGAQLVTQLPAPLDIHTAYTNAVTRTLQHHAEILAEQHAVEVSKITAEGPMEEDVLAEKLLHLQKQYMQDFLQRCYVDTSSEAMIVSSSSLEAMLVHNQESLPEKNAKAAEAEAEALWASLSRRLPNVKSVMPSEFVSASEATINEFIKLAKGPARVVQKLASDHLAKLLRASLEEVCELHVKENDNVNRLKMQAVFALFGSQSKGFLRSIVIEWRNVARHLHTEGALRKRKQLEQDKLMFAFGAMCASDDKTLLRNAFIAWSQEIHAERTRKAQVQQEEFTKKLLGKVVMHLMGQGTEGLLRLTFQAWTKMLMDERLSKINRTFSEQQKKALMAWAMTDEKTLMETAVREWRRVITEEKLSNELKKLRAAQQWALEGPLMAQEQISNLELRLRRYEEKPTSCCTIC